MGNSTVDPVANWYVLLHEYLFYLRHPLRHPAPAGHQPRGMGSSAGTN